MSVNSVATIRYETLNSGDMESLGEKVKRLRGRKPIDRVARDTGVTRDAVWRLETGRTPNPRWDTIEGLAKAFGLSAEVLLEGTETIIEGGPDVIPSPIPDTSGEIPPDDLARAIVRAKAIPNRLTSEDVERAMSILSKDRGMSPKNLEAIGRVLAAMTGEAENDPEIIPADVPTVARQAVAKGVVDLDRPKGKARKK